MSKGPPWVCSLASEGAGCPPHSCPDSASYACPPPPPHCPLGGRPGPAPHITLPGASPTPVSSAQQAHQPHPLLEKSEAMGSDQPRATQESLPCPQLTGTPLLHHNPSCTPGQESIRALCVLVPGQAQPWRERARWSQEAWLIGAGHPAPLGAPPTPSRVKDEPQLLLHISPATQGVAPRDHL